MTLARLAPLLPKMGITRLADVTRLDELGIPVFQAIRPNSRNLSVSQGKGLTPALARVSAAMEAAEFWHAESLPGETIRAPVGDMLDRLPYNPAGLTLHEPNALNDGMDVEWIVATDLSSGQATYVPKDLIVLDWTVCPRWTLPVFRATSNGLASGNTLEEAITHGLYEVIERDAIARARHRGQTHARRLDLNTVDDADGGWLLECMSHVGATVEVFDLTGPTNVACFQAVISSEGFPTPFGGYGCHFDRQVALCRAVTEAAQSRLTIIAGARDDLSQGFYVSAPQITPAWAAAPHQRYQDVPSVVSEDLESDLADLITRVRALTGFAPIAVELTRAEIGLPVVAVVAPGMLFKERH